MLTNSNIQEATLHLAHLQIHIYMYTSLYTRYKYTNYFHIDSVFYDTKFNLFVLSVIFCRDICVYENQLCPSATILSPDILSGVYTSKKWLPPQELSHSRIVCAGVMPEPIA